MKNRYLIYFIISGLIMGSFYGALIHNNAKAEGFYVGQSTYYFSAYDALVKWGINPEYMTDSNEATYARERRNNTAQHLTALNSSFCVDGTIKKVEFRIKGQYSGTNGDIYVKPYLAGLYGDVNWCGVTNVYAWSNWIDITTDTNMPSQWTCFDVGALDLYVYSYIKSGITEHFCGQVELRVTYYNYEPVVNNVVPSNYSVCVNKNSNFSAYIYDRENNGKSINYSFYDCIDNSLDLYQSFSGYNDTYVKNISSLSYGKTYKVIITVIEAKNTQVNYTFFTTSCYVSPCGNTSLTIYNNTAHTTGKYESNYDLNTGWKIYLNYTGIIPSIFLFENLMNVSGSHNYSWNNDLWVYNVWANYTGNITEGNCSGIYWFNYSDDNLTINISFNKDNNLYENSGYEINENSWFYTASAIFLDNAQFFIIMILSLWLFFVSKYLKHKDKIIAFAIFGLSIPLSIIVATISLDYAFGYFVVFIIPILSLVMLADSYFYAKK
jgi:hypothetical protein